MVEKLLPAPPEHRLLPAPKRRVSRARLLLFAFLALLALAAAFFLGFIPRRNRQRQAEALATQQAGSFPVVNATAVRRSPAVATLLLPGSASAYQESYLYARATGYVSKRYVDIGDRVHSGQLLAEIDAPDLDAQVLQAQAQVAQAERQLAQARASLENANAAEDLARVTVDRYKVLVDHGAVSRQDYDQQNANYKQAHANTHLQEAAIETAQENIRANRANLDHLIALQSFKQVRAPFDGVITARNFDVGALVTASGSTQGASNTPLGGTQAAAASNNAGSNGSQPQAPSPSLPSIPTTPGIGTSGELYRIAQIDRLRVLVSVPQESAAAIQVGSPASVYVAEYGNRAFQGNVTRTARSIDAISRTLPTEVQVPNNGWLLLPGMFAQVRFTDTRPSPPLLVPGDAIITVPDGLYVAALAMPTQQDRERIESQQKAKQQSGKQAGKNQQQSQDPNQIRRIQLVRVQVGRDYGPVIEIVSGLKGPEYIVVNPGDMVQEGALVMPKAAPPVAGENANQQPAPSQQEPTAIQSPSMAAPTQAPQLNQGKGSGKGKGVGNQKEGSGK
jgi:multidrug efflux pump subunit AcrA (membrane-fusion protein)